jgi:hypothetical protein
MLRCLSRVSTNTIGLRASRVTSRSLEQRTIFAAAPAHVQASRRPLETASSCSTPARSAIMQLQTRTGTAGRARGQRGLANSSGASLVVPAHTGVRCPPAAALGALSSHVSLGSSSSSWAGAGAPSFAAAPLQHRWDSLRRVVARSSAAACVAGPRLITVMHAAPGDAVTWCCMHDCANDACMHPTR